MIIILIITNQKGTIFVALFKQLEFFAILLRRMNGHTDI